MNLLNEKGRLWKWTGLFFAAMLVFTLLSRAVYQNSVAVVTTAAPTNGAIAHSLQISGKTVQNQEVAVTTVAGLRIAGVRVNEGQQVAQGEVLFTLDMDYLEETILYQEQEMKKQKLSVQDMVSQQKASQRQRDHEQARAEENYDSAVFQAETLLERAERDLERAEAALKAFQDGPAAEAQLAAVCQQAKGAYEEAVLSLEQLRQALEAEIQAAVEQAEEPSPETQEQIAQSLRDEYAPVIAAAEQEVQRTRTAMEEADAALEVFRQDQSGMTEQELLDAVERAQEAYDDALAALENAEIVYGRAVEAASLPEGSNHSAQIGQITLDQMALSQEKLKALREENGEVLAPVDGIVTESYLQTGDKTSDSTAVLLADMSQGCKFSGLVMEEQSKYIGVGDKVTIRSGSNGKRYQDLPVTTLSATEEPGGGYRITVQLPAGTLSLGASAELLFTKKSQPYGCCVPLSALRLDERNRPYVLVMEQVDTVLGMQTQAKKVSVTVLDQNETMAALAEGAVGSQQQVIVGSDRVVDSGSRVRVE